MIFYVSATFVYMDVSFSAIISEEHILFAYAAILSELYALILSLIKFKIGRAHV